MTEAAILAIFRLMKIESRWQLLNFKKCNVFVSLAALDMDIFTHPPYLFRSVRQLSVFIF